MGKTKRAYSYLRFSTPEQMKGDSFRRQADAAADYAARHGLELDLKLTFHDLGLSAFRGKNAEVGRLADFLEAVKAGLVPRGSVLLVESLDRISRQSARKALRTLEDIVEEGITLVTLSDNREYTADNLDSDPTALLMSVLIFMRANEESAMKARRLKAAWHGKRLKMAEGKPLTSKGPAWLKLNKATQKWEVLEDRAMVVANIFEAALAGHGCHLVAESLNRDKIPVFGYGQRWHASYVRKILDNPAVIGDFTPLVHEHSNGKIVSKPAGETIHGYYPAVISEETFRQTQTMRLGTTSSQRGSNAHSALHNLFGGLAHCARCGATMNMINKGEPPKGGRYLVCSSARYGAGCKYTAVRYDRLEQVFLERAQEMIETAPAGDDAPDVDEMIRQLRVRLEEAEAGYQDFARKHLADRSNDYNGAQAQAADAERKSLRQSLGELEDKQKMTAGPLVAKRKEELRAALRRTPLDRTVANALLKACFSGVLVDPGNSSAILTWRHGGEFHLDWVDSPFPVSQQR